MQEGVDTWHGENVSWFLGVRLVGLLAGAMHWSQVLGTGTQYKVGQVEQDIGLSHWWRGSRWPVPHHALLDNTRYQVLCTTANSRSHLMHSQTHLPPDSTATSQLIAQHYCWICSICCYILFHVDAEMHWVSVLAIGLVQFSQCWILSTSHKI